MNRHACAGVLATVMSIVLAGCQSTKSQDHPSAELDHVIVGVSDLAAGVAAFQAATGVVPAYGGQHPGRGTENALVSLGNGVYLEIIAPRRDAPDDNEMVRALRALSRPTPVGWALRVKDAGSVRASLQRRGFETSEPRAGSRRTPSGDLLEWETFGVAMSETDAVPFFIAWGASTRHPSTTAPGGCTLDGFQVEDPAGSTLSRLLRALEVSIPVRTAERTAMTIAIKCSDRKVVFATE